MSGAESLTKEHKSLGNRHLTGVLRGAESLAKQVIANYLPGV